MHFVRMVPDLSHEATGGVAHIVGEQIPYVRRDVFGIPPHALACHRFHENAELVRGLLPDIHGVRNEHGMHVHNLRRIDACPIHDLRNHDRWRARGLRDLQREEDRGKHHQSLLPGARS